MRKQTVQVLMLTYIVSFYSGECCHLVISQGKYFGSYQDECSRGLSLTLCFGRITINDVSQTKNSMGVVSTHLD